MSFERKLRMLKHKWRRAHNSIKGMIIMFVVGATYHSFNHKSLRLIQWFTGYFKWLENIFIGLNPVSMWMLPNYMKETWWFTLFSVFLVWWLIYKFFGRKRHGWK